MALNLSWSPEMEAKAATVLTLLAEEETKRTRVPRPSDYNGMIQAKRRQVAALVERMKEGRISIPEFEAQFRAKIEAAHSSAVVLGRQRAGDLRDKTKIDNLFGIIRADGDGQYLAKFIEDLKAGRYGFGEDFKEDQVMSRASMYLDKARGTANESFVLGSPRGSRFDWVMLGPENHCADCPALAAGGPYLRSAISQHPGDGKTPCITNCKCVWVRHDKVTGFAYVPEAA